MNAVKWKRRGQFSPSDPLLGTRKAERQQPQLGGGPSVRQCSQKIILFFCLLEDEMMRSACRSKGVFRADYKFMRLFFRPRRKINRHKNWLSYQLRHTTNEIDSTWWQKRERFFSSKVIFVFSNNVTKILKQSKVSRNIGLWLNNNFQEEEWS